MTSNGIALDEISVTSQSNVWLSVERGISIREMQIGDISILVDMGSDMHRESVYARMDYDLDKTTRIGLSVLASDDKLGIVAIFEGKIVGFFLGGVVEYFFGTDRMAYDLLLYVVPEMRGSAAAKMLIECYKTWAFAKGVTEVCAGVSAQEDNSRTYAFYRSMGFKECGRTFKWRPRDV